MIFQSSTAPRRTYGSIAASPELYRVPPHNWVTTATLYIEGQAAHWLQAYRQAHRALGWDAFCAAIREEFGADEFELEMN